MSSTAWMWIAIGAMALGGILSTLFHSLRDMTRSLLDELAVSRGKRAAQHRVERILEDVDGHAAAVALPRMLCTLIMAVAVVSWIEVVRGEDGGLSRPVALVLGVVGGSLLLWVFNVVVPHAVAAHAAEGTVYHWSWLIRACHATFRPLLAVVRFFDEVVRRLAGKTASSGAEEIEAELMSVVDEAQEEGQFDEVERRMIAAVVGFSRTTVEQIMTPRTEVEALELTNNLGEIVKFIRQSRHSRIPVYEGNLDQIVGMFYIKDLMRWLAGDGPRATGAPFDLKAILRPAYFVPETKTIRELLEELVAKKIHVAMVADEYGGTSGLVTLEDIVEEIFGEIQDEYEQAEDDLPEVHVEPTERTADIDARAYIRDANEALRVMGYELPEGPEYDTVGGLVVTTLGRIPTAGETLRIGDGLITVMAAEPTRVDRVRLELRPPEDTAEAASDDAETKAGVEQRI